MYPIRYCLLLLCWLLPIGALSADEAKPPLRFMTADVWPWGYIDEYGQPAGLLSRLANRLSELSDLPLDNRVLPHQRLVHELRLHRADFAVLFENPTLDSFASSLGVVIQADILLVTRPSNSLKLNLEGLSGRKVAYIRGTYYGESFTADQHIIKVPVHNLDQAVEMLLMGRIDALISSDLVLHHTLDALGMTAGQIRIAVHAPGHPGHLYMSDQPSHPEQAQAMQGALEQLRASGELRELFDRSLLINE